MACRELYVHECSAALYTAWHANSLTSNLCWQLPLPAPLTGCSSVEMLVPAGVQKDPKRKGELWGLENLLKLTEGSVRTQGYVSNPALEAEEFHIEEFDAGDLPRASKPAHWHAQLAICCCRTHDPSADLRRIDCIMPRPLPVRRQVAVLAPVMMALLLGRYIEDGKASGPLQPLEPAPDPHRLICNPHS